MPYSGHWLGKSYLSVETQSVFSTALAVWATADWEQPMTFAHFWVKDFFKISFITFFIVLVKTSIVLAMLPFNVYKLLLYPSLWIFYYSFQWMSLQQIYHDSVSWWSFAGVDEALNLLRCPGLFWAFQPILAMLWCYWARLFSVFWGSQCIIYK